MRNAMRSLIYDVSILMFKVNNQCKILNIYSFKFSNPFLIIINL